jgi:uncharacterized protein (DUF486 family)
MARSVSITGSIHPFDFRQTSADRQKEPVPKSYNSTNPLAENPMPSTLIQTVALLTASNLFMTFAWYAHLKNLSHRPWMVAVVVSWAIAFFEYCLQVPANRLGFQSYSLPQLKILQEVIALAVFVPFSLLYMGQAVRWNFLWAGLCLMGAVFFIFRS